MDNVSEALSGLSTAEVRQRRLQGQSNGCFEIKTKSVARIIGDNVFTLFNLINVLLAVFVLLTGSYRNMLFMGVVVSNTAIGVIQEIRSKRVIDRLSLISAPKAHLIRDGIECSEAVSDIVVDDIMLLSTGRQVCADAVVVSGDCEVDESLITGESDPVVKSVGCELLSGSFVVSGAAKARVIRVGAESYANKITSGAKYMKKQTSDMMNSINKIINTVAVCIVPFALLLFFKAIFVIKQEFGHGIVSTVAVLIGMIPEGLVLLTSVALAVSSVRLAKRQILCQDLFCIENLARVDILCLDKTGTLTEGCMDVVEVVKLDEDYNAERALAALSSVMTDVNPTLAAIKTRYGSDKTEVCTSVIPFSSARKWSAAVTEEYGALILGAPQFVLSGSAYSCVQPIVEKYAGSGLRVLLLASSESAPENCTLPADISPKALVLLSDRVRRTAPQTMEYFRKQGVALKVISGDDPVTAASVAKRAGLMSADRYIDASALSDEELCDAAENYTVFGRVSPQQKLMLVQALKANGHKVAMTGDGANDVLALKEADCSVAMQSGSDAARSVSQLVLLDSDFSSMPHVVEEGRRVINNIQRSAALFLVKTVFSFLLAVVFLFVSEGYPFQPVQMTLISTLAVGVPSFILALQPNRNRVRGSFVSNVMSRAFPGGLSVTLGIVLLLIAQWTFGIPDEQVSAMAVYLAAVVCFAVLFRVCRPFNKLRAVMFCVLTGGFVAAVLLFPSMFYIVSLSRLLWLCVCIIAVIELLCLVLLTKAFSRSFKADKDTVLPSRYSRPMAAVVCMLSMLFAVWFGVLLVDYFALAFGKQPVVAELQDNGSYEGMFYSVSDGEIHILGHDVEPVLPQSN